MHEWLRRHHDRMATPRPLIDRWVRAATGSPIGSAHRIVVGQDNEVHDVVTDEGQRMVARSSRCQSCATWAEAA